MRRRRFLAVAATGTALAAGCVGDTGSGGIDESLFDDYLGDIPEYEGPVDRRNEDEVTIQVGAMEGADYLRFDPMGVVVTSGTTILWEWTGNGGEHYVVSRRDTTNRSERTAEEGYTWEVNYNRTGTTRYVCATHEDQQMLAAIDGRADE
jgi:halocyanin-like protein